MPEHQIRKGYRSIKERIAERSKDPRRSAALERARARLQADPERKARVMETFMPIGAFAAVVGSKEPGR